MKKIPVTKEMREAVEVIVDTWTLRYKNNIRNIWGGIGGDMSEKEARELLDMRKEEDERRGSHFTYVLVHDGRIVEAHKT
jgi:hypothetical protein